MLIMEKTTVLTIKNDVLNFIVNNLKDSRKEKLLSFTRSYYTEQSIYNAQKVLINAIPEKRSTRRCRRVKHPDPLVAIYDCIQLIPPADLPIFEFSNESNNPNDISSLYINSMSPKKRKLLGSECLPIEFINIEDSRKESEDVIKIDQIKVEDCLTDEIENQDEMTSYTSIAAKTKKISYNKKLLMDDVAITRKEQQQLKNEVCEISNLVKELKENIDGYIKFQMTSATSTVVNKEQEDSECLQSSRSTNSKSVPPIHSRNDSVSQLQKLIDIDAKSFDDEAEDMSTLDSDEDYCSLAEDFNYGLPKKIGTRVGVYLNEKPSKRAKPLFKNILTAFDEAAKSIIVIKNDDETNDAQLVISSPDFVMKNESSIEITSSDSLLDHFVEDTASNDFINLPVEVELTEDPDPLVISDWKYVALSDRACMKLREKNQCSLCYIEKFDTDNEFRQHSRIHMKVLSYDCVICSTQFKNGKSLMHHLQNCLKQHKDSDKVRVHSCKSCGVFFGDIKTLHWHQGLHSELRKFPCSSCNYKFINKTALAKHTKNQHNPLYKYVCAFCPETFVLQTYLTSHLRTHTGERPYQCVNCGYKAATRSLLRKHFETHGDPTTVKCQQCNYICMGRNRLSKHVQKVHMEPSVCPICKKVFEFSYYLKKHFENHKHETYRCDFCKFSSRTKLSLEKHSRLHKTIPCPKCSVPIANQNNFINLHLKSFCKANVKESIVE